MGFWASAFPPPLAQAPMGLQLHLAPHREAQLCSLPLLSPSHPQNPYFVPPPSSYVSCSAYAGEALHCRSIF